MSLKEELTSHVGNVDQPIIIDGKDKISLRDILEAPLPADDLRPGDVAAIIGDFDAKSIATLINLVDRGLTVMPLTEASSAQHEYFLQAGCVAGVFQNGKFERLAMPADESPLLTKLKDQGHAGLILFTSGTTGRPKAILHDFTRFLARFSTPRNAFRTINFLLFDHIGGLNTLFHTIYNNGLVIRPKERSPEAICQQISAHNVELLPATPTFLRMLAMGGLLDPASMPSLRLITYGTERMDQSTLDMVALALPEVDLRQTYGMSELGIMRARTRKRDELWIQFGGDGVECRIEAGEVLLKSPNRMLGYLNAPSPFDDEGWYATKDLVEQDGPWLRFIGRKDGIINVGGLKVFPAEVEHAALSFPGIKFAKARGRANPITGMHVELQCESAEDVDKKALASFLATKLPAHALPRRIAFAPISIGHRCKQL